ncbi:MAG: hypothetical protein ACO1SV_12760 [Fimbriimonas sp.]
MARGAVKQETLIIGGVFIAAVVTLGAFGWRVNQRQGMLDEGARMQRLYVALSMYESQADGEFPPSLTAAKPYMANLRDLKSIRDPFLDAPGPFPYDAGLPDRLGSNTRISDAYLMAHRLAGRIKTAPWREARMDPSLGVLASEWFGSVRPKRDFQADVSGLVLRITTDGSLVRVLRDGPKPLGDVEDLFRKRAERK